MLGKPGAEQKFADPHKMRAQDSSPILNLLEGTDS